jgi:hypothetical protein
MLRNLYGHPTEALGRVSQGLFSWVKAPVVSDREGERRHQVIDPRRGPAHRRQHRQAAGAAVC